MVGPFDEATLMASGEMDGSPTMNGGDTLFSA